MHKYELKLQRTRAGKVCVCLVSAKNGKLIMKGEPINKTIDALKIAHSVAGEMGQAEVIEALPWHHRWPKNEGPKTESKLKK